MGRSRCRAWLACRQECEPLSCLRFRGQSLQQHRPSSPYCAFGLEWCAIGLEGGEKARKGRRGRGGRGGRMRSELICGRAWS